MKATRSNEVIALIALFFVAFVVRMLTYSSIFVGDEIRFLEFDPYYHMRRAVSFAFNFPHVWDFDTYLNYPYGSIVGWPPLYDWSIALISNIIGEGHPSTHLVETIGAYFPVFIGCLSVIVMYLVSKEIFNDGLISGFLLAIIPAFTQVSLLGFAGHRAAEVLLSLTIYLFFLKALKVDDLRTRFIFSSIAGFVLALAIFTWLGTPIFIGIILIYAVLQNIIDKKNNKDAPLYLEYTGFLVFSSALIFTIIIYLLYKSPSLYISSGEVSFFHIGFLIVSIAVFGILRMLYRTVKTWYTYLLVLTGITSILYIILYLYFPSIYETLNSGLAYLIRERTLLQQVKEAQPLFFTFQGKFTLEPAWYAFNSALYIALAGSILLIIRLKNRSLKLTQAKLMFLVWTLIALVLNLYQTRFVYHFTLNVVILCTFLITELYKINKKYIKIIGIGLFIAILIPSAQIISGMAKYPLMFSNDWFTSLYWLRDNTPDPAGGWIFPLKNETPEYGIMAWWDYGNYILYLSKRPVIANNFQLGAEDSARFFTSENETEANGILDRRRARYVIVDYRQGMNPVKTQGKFSLRGAFVAAAFLSGKDMSYYLDKNNLPNEKYFNTMYARLYLFDGKGMAKYKLVYKSQTLYPDIFYRPIEEIKIFEYVGPKR